MKPYPEKWEAYPEGMKSIVEHQKSLKTRPQ
jgi:hypothetical protein